MREDADATDLPNLQTEGSVGSDGDGRKGGGGGLVVDYVPVGHGEFGVRPGPGMGAREGVGGQRQRNADMAAPASGSGARWGGLEKGRVEGDLRT